MNSPKTINDFFQEICDRVRLSKKKLNHLLALCNGRFCKPITQNYSFDELVPIFDSVKHKTDILDSRKINLETPITLEYPIIAIGHKNNKEIEMISFGLIVNLEIILSIQNVLFDLLEPDNLLLISTQGQFGTGRDLHIMSDKGYSFSLSKLKMRDVKFDNFLGLSKLDWISLEDLKYGYNGKAFSELNINLDKRAQILITQKVHANANINCSSEYITPEKINLFNEFLAQLDMVKKLNIQVNFYFSYLSNDVSMLHASLAGIFEMLESKGLLILKNKILLNITSHECFIHGTIDLIRNENPTEEQKNLSKSERLLLDGDFNALESFKQEKYEEFYDHFVKYANIDKEKCMDFEGKRPVVGIEPREIAGSYNVGQCFKAMCQFDEEDAFTPKVTDYSDMLQFHLPNYHYYFFVQLEQIRDTDLANPENLAHIIGFEKEIQSVKLPPLMSAYLSCSFARVYAIAKMFNKAEEYLKKADEVKTENDLDQKIVKDHILETRAIVLVCKNQVELAVKFYKDSIANKTEIFFEKSRRLKPFLISIITFLREHQLFKNIEYFLKFFKRKLKLKDVQDISYNIDILIEEMCVELKDNHIDQAKNIIKKIAAAFKNLKDEPYKKFRLWNIKFKKLLSAISPNHGEELIPFACDQVSAFENHKLFCDFIRNVITLMDKYNKKAKGFELKQLHVEYTLRIYGDKSIEAFECMFDISKMILQNNQKHLALEAARRLIQSIKGIDPENPTLIEKYIFAAKIAHHLGKDMLALEDLYNAFQLSIKANLKEKYHSEILAEISKIFDSKGNLEEAIKTNIQSVHVSETRVNPLQVRAIKNTEIREAENERNVDEKL